MPASSSTGGGGPDVERERPDVAEDVRRSRAAAWADFYRVLMICGDRAVEDHARHALTLTRRMKYAPDRDQVRAASDEVHAAVDTFARTVASTVLAPKQPPLGVSASSPRSPR